MDRSNVQNIRSDLVTVQDVLDGILPDVLNVKSLVIVAEMNDGELKSGHSEQFSSDLALKGLLIMDLAKKVAIGE